MNRAVSWGLWFYRFSFGRKSCVIHLTLRPQIASKAMTATIDGRKHVLLCGFIKVAKFANFASFV